MPTSQRPTRRRLPEFTLIRQIASRLPRRPSDVIAGIGDDAAIVRLDAGSDLLLTTDLLAERIHFDPRTASWADIGFKAVAANASDIAAMGGRPRHLLIAVALSPTTPVRAVPALYRGIRDACRRWGITLVGGDTSASASCMFLSLALTGIVPRGRALRRSGARIGDDIYVTGTLGDARAGLELLSRSVRRNGRPLLAGSRRFLIERHRRPAARVAEGARLSARRVATAAIDLSDGLSGDLRHVCEQSRVGAEIDAVRLPISQACRKYAAATGRSAIDLALAGGEDYELLFTAPVRHRQALIRLFGGRRPGISRIGTIRPRVFGLQLREASGRRAPLPNRSYEHFR